MLAGRAGPARFVCVLYMVLCAKERITGCCAGTGRAGARRTRKREKWTPKPILRVNIANRKNNNKNVNKKESTKE